MKAMQIEVINWEKYNPRSEAKAWSWFRLENDFFDDDDLFDLTASQVLVFLFCCCRRSKSGATVFKLNPGQAAQKARTTAEEAVQTIRLLSDRGKIKIHDPHVPERTSTHVDVRENTDPPPTNVRTYETNGTRRTKTPKGVSPQLGDESPRGVPPSPFDLSLADTWAEHALTLIPKLKVDRVKWADAIRLLRTADGLTETELTQTFEWIKADDFWRQNAISPIAIRTRSKNGLKKIQNIRLRMQETGADGPAFGTPEYWAECERLEQERELGAQ